MKKAIERFKNNNRGATLIELITSVAVFGIVAAAAIGLLVFVTKINADELEKTIDLSRITQTESLIRKTGYSSSEVTVGSNGDTTTFTFDGDRQFSWNGETGELIHGSVVLLSGVSSMTLSPQTPGSYKYITVTFTVSGRQYEIFVNCRNKSG